MKKIAMFDKENWLMWWESGLCVYSFGLLKCSMCKLKGRSWWRKIKDTKWWRMTKDSK